MSPLHNPAHEEKRGLSFVLAVLMHAVLAVALLISVQWKTKKPAPVVVELWGGQPPAPQTQSLPQPKVKPAKVEPAKPEVVPEKVDIATEKVKATAKPTSSPTPTPKPSATPKATAAPTATPKATAVPKATPAPAAKATPVPKAKPTKAPPKSELQDALSLDNVVASNEKPATKAVAGGKAGGTGNNPKAVGNSGTGSGSGSNAAGMESYKGRLTQQIKSRTVYDKSSGNPTAEFSVVVLPDGTILASQLELVSSNGDPAYAEATRRAILSMGRFPALPDGKTFTGELRTWKIKFRLKDVDD